MPKSKEKTKGKRGDEETDVNTLDSKKRKLVKNFDLGNECKQTEDDEG